jgi:hypothetical protein
VGPARLVHPTLISARLAVFMTLSSVIGREVVCIRSGGVTAHRDFEPRISTSRGRGNA